MDCVTLHLLSVFHSDVAETQQFYISKGLKKPNRVPIRQFVQRIQQLNSYLDLMPCHFYSKHATKLTKVMELFNEMDLASHILRMVPKHWQDQYGSWGVLYPRVSASYSKCLSTSKRPS